MESTVSVVIPAYNAGAFITRALKSFEQQTRKPDEIVVVDDGSTDDTGAQVEMFIKNSNLKVILVTQSNRGSPVARNNGIRHSKSDFIAFMDADDYIYPEFIEEMLSGLVNYPHWVACFSDRDIVDTDGNILAKDLDHPLFKEINKKIMQNDFIELADPDLFSKTVSGSLIPMTVVCRRVDVEAVSGFDESILFHDDRMFMLKLIRRGMLGYKDKSLGVWQRHATNKTGSVNWQKGFIYSDIILAKVLDRSGGFNLSAQEERFVLSARCKLAVQWVYAASHNRSWSTFALGCKFFAQRRITTICAFKAFARYFLHT